MGNPIRFLLIVLIGGFLILAGTIFYTVRQDEQAIVLRFGAPQGGAINVGEGAEEAPGAGLHIKLPWDEVIYFDRKNLEFDLSKPIEIIVANEERLLVDAFVRYQIVDPLLYYQALSPSGSSPTLMRSSFDTRLTNILSEAMRGQLGSRTIRAIINTERAETMAAIRSDVTDEARKLGVRIIDVRIRQADFPDANANQVHERMISNYRQQAELIRANGDAEARKIRAAADEQVVRIRSAAEETAQVFQGRADAIRNCIFAEAYEGVPAKIEESTGDSPIDTSDMSDEEILALTLDQKLAIFEAKLPITCRLQASASRQNDAKRREFFDFYRSMTAYEKTLGDDGTTIILSPTSDFFKYFNDADGKD
ncbi:MAG: protease modulator HflC [Parvularcula sp.]